MFKKILVAVDGSEPANKALRVAADLAGKYDAEILILCVYRHYSPLESSLSMVRPYEPDPPDKALNEFAQEVIANAKTLIAEAGFDKAEGFVKRGQPARTIVKFAKDRDIDLIVMGSRGLGDIEGFLLGSVAHKVTSLAHCLCLTVK